jgi:hypothetical protein
MDIIYASFDAKLLSIDVVEYSWFEGFFKDVDFGEKALFVW